MDYYSTVLFHLKKDHDLAHLVHTMLDEKRCNNEPETFCVVGSLSKGEHLRVWRRHG